VDIGRVRGGQATLYIGKRGRTAERELRKKRLMSCDLPGVALGQRCIGWSKTWGKKGNETVGAPADQCRGRRKCHGWKSHLGQSDKQKCRTK